MARVRRGIRFAPERGSHLPMLMKAVSITTGPIVELGCGVYSTNPLHWACFVEKRRIVTYENNPAYYDFLLAYERDFHEVHCVEAWDDVDLSENWSVAFVDHDPGPSEPPDRRWREVLRLGHAQYVVVHDTERTNESVHKISVMKREFKHHFQYHGARPNTTIFSNFHDVSDFL